MGQLLLVRHGQASAFEENYDRLSPLGERQAQLLGESWARRGVRPDRVYCGPRARQMRTAEIAGAAAGLPELRVLPELDEMNVEPLFREALPELFARHAHLASLGDAMLAAEGDAQRGDAVARLFEAALMLWVRGEVTADGVEPWLQFRDRIHRALSTVRSDARGLRIAVFTSAGPVAATVQLATGAADETALSLAFRVRNSSVSEFVFGAAPSWLRPSRAEPAPPGSPRSASPGANGERFSLVSFNETPHLSDAAMVTVR